MEKRISYFTGLIVIVLIVLMADYSISQDNKATKKECEAKCKEAAALVKEIGLDATIKKIMEKNSSFVWKNTYVFSLELDSGTTLANPVTPGLIGVNVKKLKDINGKLFGVEFLNTAKTKGEGWVTYLWPKPGEKKPSSKMTYVYRVPNENVIMLAGIYED